MADNSASELFPKPPVSPTLNGAPGDQSQLSGVDGDIKQAFGKQAASKNLRDDLLMAADNVTNAMFSLVKELNSDDDISAVPDLAFLNGDSDTADLEALERQVNQIRKSLGANEEMEQGHVNLSNGDVTMTDVSDKVISHGRERKGAPGRMGLGKLGSRRADGERADTDTDDDEMLVRKGSNKYPVRTPMTDDESYIQTDDDEGTGRTDDEDQEWQDSMRRWANR